MHGPTCIFWTNLTPLSPLLPSQVQQEKFRVVMSRWEKNQLKMRAIGQIMNPGPGRPGAIKRP
jgi:hypothetical protein